MSAILATVIATMGVPCPSIAAAADIEEPNDLETPGVTIEIPDPVETPTMEVTPTAPTESKEEVTSSSSLESLALETLDVESNPSIVPKPPNVGSASGLAFTLIGDPPKGDAVRVGDVVRYSVYIAGERTNGYDGPEKWELTFSNGYDLALLTDLENTGCSPNEYQGRFRGVTCQETDDLVSGINPGMALVYNFDVQIGDAYDTPYSTDYVAASIETISYESIYRNCFAGDPSLGGWYDDLACQTRNPVEESTDTTFRLRKDVSQDPTYVYFQLPPGLLDHEYEFTYAVNGTVVTEENGDPKIIRMKPSTNTVDNSVEIGGVIPGDYITVYESLDSLPDIDSVQCDWSIMAFQENGVARIASGTVEDGGALTLTAYNSVICSKYLVNIEKDWQGVTPEQDWTVDVDWAFHTDPDDYTSPESVLKSGTVTLSDANSWAVVLDKDEDGEALIFHTEERPYLTLTERDRRPTLPAGSEWASPVWTYDRFIPNTPGGQDPDDGVWENEVTWTGESFTTPFNCVYDPNTLVRGGAIHGQPWCRISYSVTNRALEMGWTLWKDSDPESGSVVAPGSTITYTLHAENTGEANLQYLVVTDDLSDVLRSGEVVTTEEELASRGLSVGTGSPYLYWELPELKVGETLEVSFDVRIDDDALDREISNVVGSTSYPAPDQCVLVWGDPSLGTEPEWPTEEEACTTIHRTPSPVTPPTMPPLGGTGGWMFTVAGALVLAGAGSTALLVRNGRRAER